MMTALSRGRIFWSLAIAGGISFSWLWSERYPLVETDLSEAAGNRPLDSVAPLSISENTPAARHPALPSDEVLQMSAIRTGESSADEAETLDSGVRPAVFEVDGDVGVPGAVWLSGTIEMDEPGLAPAPLVPEGSR